MRIAILPDHFSQTPLPSKSRVGEFVVLCLRAVTALQAIDALFLCSYSDFIITFDLKKKDICRSRRSKSFGLDGSPGENSSYGIIRLQTCRFLGRIYHRQTPKT